MNSRVLVLSRTFTFARKLQRLLWKGVDIMKILIGCTLIVIGSVRIIKTIKDIRNDKEGIFINVNDVK
mgnify:CR=1 FL=1